MINVIFKRERGIKLGNKITNQFIKISISTILLTSSLFMLDSFSKTGSENNRIVYAAQTTMTKPITVTLAGDVMFEGDIKSQINKYGVDYPFKYVNTYFKKSDLTVVNLETSISTRGKAASKQFTFRANPSVVKGIKNSGIDVVSLANNHTLDYGTTALFDTMNYLKKSNIGTVGAGKNSQEAFSAQYRVINGKRIAIIGLSRVLPEASWFASNTKAGIASAYSTNPMMNYVKTAVKKSDYTIIMIHWNKERKDYPEDYARKLGKQFIDLGVDAVIGGHSHTLMGSEIYKGAPIYYSLGNFIFDGSSDPRGQESMIVRLTLQNNKVASSIIPLKIVKGIPRPVDNAYNQKIIKKLNKISYQSKFASNGTLTK
jgi:poly-gamma-glutamate capsule biosynthesis protein CapA/YwtB (metallophosphatase superfamily)